MEDLFLRSPSNPILRPDGVRLYKIYNPGAVRIHSGTTHLYPRLVGEDGISAIGHAASDENGSFELDSQLALAPNVSSGELGLEDARVTQIGDRYFMTFSVNHGDDVDLHIAEASLPTGPWERRGSALEDFHFAASGGVRVRWKNGNPYEKYDPKGHDRRSKSGALFPWSINGAHYLLFGEFQIWLATSRDGFKFQAVPGPFLTPRKNTNYFDNAFVEMGPPPILTDHGWLIFYHGVDVLRQYRLGLLVLDRDDPSIIRYRSDDPVFCPSAPYELEEGPIDVIPGARKAFEHGDARRLHDFYKRFREDNIVPKVTFVTGATVDNDTVHLYYGAADHVVCEASAPLRAILNFVH